MKPRALALLASVAVVATTVVWLAAPPDAAPAAAVVLRPEDSRLLAVVERAYALHCSVCHCAQLEGQPDRQTRGVDGLLPAPPHGVSGHTWHHDDALLFAIVKHGVAQAAGLPGHRSAMPAYAGVLADDEVVAVLSWIKAQWPARERAFHDGLNRQAALAR